MGSSSFDLDTNTCINTPQFNKIFGFEPGQANDNAAWSKLLHPFDREAILSSLANCMEQGIGYDRDYRIIRNGEIRWIRGIAQAEKDPSGKVIRISRVEIDITDRKNTEEQINNKNEQLEKLNSEKDKFFSIIAHDLRGPFNGFLGLTQIMAEQLTSLTLVELQEISKGMNKSAKNLFSLLNNLLEWSRMQRGSINFEPKSIPLLPFVNTTLQPTIDTANTKGIGVNILVPENINVFADENMLSSTISNLASNAIKFTPKGGSVSLSAKSTADGPVEFSIQDTGIGMDPETLDNMFKLDVSISRKGTEGEPSTGLGLLLCKDFIDRHGGKIWAESEEGKGSTFYFTLPAKASRIAT